MLNTHNTRGRGAVGGRGAAAGGRGLGPPPAGRGNQAAAQDPAHAPAGQAQGAQAAQGPTEVEVVLYNLDFPQPVINYLVQQEFIRYLSDFLTIQKDVIDKIFTRMDNQQIHYSAALHLSLTKYLHSYIRRYHLEGRPINIASITIDVLRREQDYFEDNNKFSDQKAPSEPDKFVKDTKWRQFKDTFSNYLDGVKGTKRIALSYVIRPEIPPLGYDINDPMYTTELFGRQFQEDNKKVFILLERCVLGGPAESYISPYKASKDGRAAFIALDTMYSGGPYQVSQVIAAWKNINEAKYNGRKANFTFAMYRKIFDDAWRDLANAAQTVMDRSKVTFLINGLEGDHLLAIKNAVITNDDLMNCYERAAIYIATCLTNQESAIVMPKARAVSTTLSTKVYSEEEWRNLSLEDRSEIIQKRKDEAKVRGSSDDRRRNDRGRGLRTTGRGGRGGRGGRTDA